MGDAKLVIPLSCTIVAAALPAGRLSGTVVDDVPIQRLATAVQLVSTARESSTVVFLQGGREVELHLSGIVDYANGLTMLTRTSDGTEFLINRSDILRRLTEDEQRETGKTWRFEASRDCPDCANDEFGRSISLLLQVAEPISIAIESIKGEQLHHYTFRVRARRDHEDMMIARMYDHVRYHRLAHIIFDIWINEDGELRGMRNHVAVARWAQNQVNDISAPATIGILTALRK